MNELDRRSFLAGVAATGLVVAGTSTLTACGGDSSDSGSSGGSKTTKQDWWEGSEVRATLNKKILADAKAELDGVTVEVTYQSNTKIGQALQLAKESNQLPDITAIGGLGVPLSALIDGGWLQPLDLPDEAAARVEAMDLYEGIHIFDGKIYTFPGESPDHNMVNWYHTKSLEQADVDPAQPPTTYDDFRDALHKIRSRGETNGLLLAMVDPARNASQVDWLAQAAGFEGAQGLLFSTGEYAFDSDEYANAIEYFMSLKKDKLLVPGELTLDVKTGQARWAGGESAFFFDGPWIAGNVAISYPQLEGTFGAGPLLVPDSSYERTSYGGPTTGLHYITNDAEDPELANKILALTTTKDYQIGLSEAMGHPPRDPKMAETTDVYDVWRDIVADLQENHFIPPKAIIRNPEIAKVDAAIKPVAPDLGTIIQGYFTGDVSDLRPALQKLSDDSNKELDRAIEAAKGKGAKVSRDDYAFPEWKPRTSFTSDMY